MAESTPTTAVHQNPPFPNLKHRSSTPSTSTISILLHILTALTITARLPHTTQAYIIYEEPEQHHRVHRFPSVPSLHAGALSSSDPTQTHRPNLFLGPIGNLYLCDTVRFYDPNTGRTSNLRGGADGDGTTQRADPNATPERRTASPPLALLIPRGGGCDPVDKVRNALLVNTEHVRGDGPRVRFLLLYDDDNERPSEFLDRDDVALKRDDGGTDDDGLRVFYLGRKDGFRLKRLIEGYGKVAHPLEKQYPPFLLSDGAFVEKGDPSRSPWEFIVGVDGIYLAERLPRREVEAELKKDGEQLDL